MYLFLPLLTLFLATPTRSAPASFPPETAQSKLVSRLHELMPSSNEQKSNSEIDDIFIVPGDLLPRQPFSPFVPPLGHGLMFPFPFGPHVDVVVDGEKVPIYLPMDTKALFIHETDDGEFPPKSTDDALSAPMVDLVLSSFPFKSSAQMELDEFFLIVPAKMAAKNNTSSMIRASMTEFPLFRQCTADSSSLLVLLFKKSQEKPSLPSFLDGIANDWVSSLGLQHLVLSVFCTANSNDSNKSYCLKVDEEQQKVDIFPSSARLKREEPVVHQQIITQVHGKLYRAAEKFNDESYDLVHNPKTYLREKDRQLDDKIKILGDKQKISDNLQQEDIQRENRKYIKHNAIDSRKFSYKRDEGYSVPLSEISFLQNVSSPRSPQFAQVIFYEPPPKLDSREDCKPITWFNIFHHSIFGSSNFCK